MGWPMSADRRWAVVDGRTCGVSGTFERVLYAARPGCVRGARPRWHGDRAMLGVALAGPQRDGRRGHVGSAPPV
jgi:hypothetical protein